MSLTLRWVGEEDFDRVALTRTRCYAAGAKEAARFGENLRAENRSKAGDFLLAERDGEAVGTASSYSFTMWVRAAPLRCQGVAYVGTVRTARRSGGISKGLNAGVATQLMHETLRKAREREEIVSALMPFRASFYEHFGYGLSETRV